MADESGGDSQERTYEPTQRRMEEAIKRGDIIRSMEVNTWFILLGLTLTILIALAPTASLMTGALRGYLENFHQLSLDKTGFGGVLKSTLGQALLALMLPLSIGVSLGLAGTMLQQRPLWTSDPLSPKWSRLSPLSGMKRIFGKEAMVQFLKGLAKILMIGALCVTVLWSEHDRLEASLHLDVMLMLPLIQSLAIKLLIGVLALFGVVAGLDYLYQRMAWLGRNRMTQRELKEEFKESEGNPEVKGKIKQLRIQRARRRMMAKVPTATVIITNPTHYAIALHYEMGMPAPICLAKGIDSLALKIREIATQHRIPIVENPPLARALHASAEIDDEIPVEHYKAVAEVIGFVTRLRRRPSS